MLSFFLYFVDNFICFFVFSSIFCRRVFLDFSYKTQKQTVQETQTTKREREKKKRENRKMLSKELPREENHNRKVRKDHIEERMGFV